MFFPSNIVVAVILASMFIISSFKLEFPPIYKKTVRIYSLVIQVGFITFLLIFTWMINPTFDNNGLYIFYDGLTIFYCFMTIPLLISLIYFIGKWILKLDDYSFVVRILVVFIIAMVLIGLTYIGLYGFIIIFYGLAP